MERHIVALGGGGFVEGNRLLQEYVLSITGHPDPRICCLPTAGGESDYYLVRFYEACAGLRCRPSHLSLFRRLVADVREFLLAAQVIWVGGGNTSNMLAVWRVHGLEAVLKEAWSAGVVLAGVSAGAICWFEAGLTDSFGPELVPLHDGLGLLRGSFCPHYDSEARRRPAFHRFVREGLPAGIAADEGVALHFVGTELSEVVSDRPQARAYRVELSLGDVVERPLDARLLS